MDDLLKILQDMANAANRLRLAILYAEEHPEDPHCGDDIDYSRDFVIDTIHRFQTVEGV